MKKLFLFPLAAAALCFASCSSDDLDVAGNEAQSHTPGAGETGYITLNINLPVDPATSSRGVNDDFDDGVASEWAVYDATLVLFGGTTEADATIQSAYDLNLSWNTEAVNENITVQAKKTAEISTPDGTVKYALVILNRNNICSVNNKTLYVQATDMTGKTLAQLTDALNGVELEAADFTSKGILMVNAPLVDAPGTADASGANVTILANVTSCIFDTYEAAVASGAPVADIVVERAVAKVSLEAPAAGSALTVSQQTTDAEYSSTTDAPKDLKIMIEGWKLTNTNNKSYLVRNWNQVPNGVAHYGNYWLGLTSASASKTAGNDYRFAGTKVVQKVASQSSFTELGSPDRYRTYWALDPNYTAATDLVETLVANTAGAYKNSGEYDYCLENTFDVDHMLVENTTCVVVKAKVGYMDGANWEPLNSFYVFDDDRDKIYDINSYRKLIANKFDRLVGIEKVVNDYLTDNSIAYTEVTYAVNLGSIAGTLLPEGEITKDNNFKITAFNINLTVKNGAETTTPTIEVATAYPDALATLNSNLKLTKYQDGVMYYTALVQHFGEDYTPWNVDENPMPKAGSEAIQAYPQGAADATGEIRDGYYLGRYGVLRNNWYLLSVNSVKALGDASDPTGRLTDDPTPDDSLSSWINIRVNVLSWAKRTQSVDLK